MSISLSVVLFLSALWGRIEGTARVASRHQHFLQEGEKREGHRQTQGQRFSLTRSDCDSFYTHYYCEENSWHLAKSFLERTKAQGGTAGSLDREPEQGFVAFISNPQKETPIWAERGAGKDSPVLWDYHVIFLTKSEHTPSEEERKGATEVSKVSNVFDLDSTTPFPSSFSQWYEESCGSHRKEISAGRYPPRDFRVVSAESFVNCFASPDPAVTRL
uniref:Protein N-terminal glutamine amidohydrolase n=1 Tax=Chromera velia CCMP2878 TaxID=1169474 RepID=A0A0G4FH42_9ALVE|eukprot:Cvel_16981.t1-p1 / transcript=Cvel_16981.t1 / gene=Cvel_16981 / organism=Chromera_velia_CCMP2878 / gene_product=Protein N-terminal glutamine amidohydrolase, putative / transcript_product=Protein N-terminal glutamine amidohydrolase, putative / location=Cvel_scaffold1333:45624-46271(+) / protein_length=216 / sequence_SO=supercontig / SO=protein_coding / is_pseudo=false